MQQLVEKWKNEAEEKARAEADLTTKEWEEEHESNRSQKSPSSQTKEEEQYEQGGGDQESSPFWVKWNWEKEKEGLQKMSKATMSSLDPITQIEGDLDDIGDKVRDTMVELLYNFEQYQKQALFPFRRVYVSYRSKLLNCRKVSGRAVRHRLVWHWGPLELQRWFTLWILRTSHCLMEPLAQRQMLTRLREGTLVSTQLWSKDNSFTHYKQV